MSNDCRRTLKRLRPILSAVALLALALGAWFTLEPADSHGTCKTHHQYRTYDGTHDGDGDGVGCEVLPEPPGGPRTVTTTASTTSGSGYDRDNWSYNSSSARSALACDSSEHVDHIVALKEAYDSGASSWSSGRKSTFANDRANMWCLDAGLNRSKSDHDLAEWGSGSCEQRKHIAVVTVSIKRKYNLSIDAAEQRAIDRALDAQCGGARTPASATASNAGVDRTESPRVSDTPDEEPRVDESTDNLPSGRIIARRLADGRTEFGFQPQGGGQALPRARFFPADAAVDRWLQSSLVIVDGRDIGRISARLLSNGKIEFAFRLNDGERVLPPARYFPAESSGRWLRSSLITFDD